MRPQMDTWESMGGEEGVVVKVRRKKKHELGHQRCGAF